FDDSHPGRCHWAVALLAFQANKTVLKSTFQWEKQYLWVKGTASPDLRVSVASSLALGRD
ncbi:MAG: hypothetical protein K940chlam7_01968, partial [Chlamydiae bacterium]|nr:hypothetical protein [Chlamydiota bacterium]